MKKIGVYLPTVHRQFIAKRSINGKGITLQPMTTNKKPLKREDSTTQETQAAEDETRTPAIIKLEKDLPPLGIDGGFGPFV